RDAELDARAAAFDGDGDLRGARVPRHVIERLLDDSKNCSFLRRGQTLLADFARIEPDTDVVIASKLGSELSQRGGQAQLVQRGRPQVADDPANLRLALHE